ncbi:radical SAM domain-containing protein [Clostridium pasteurianum DSM 525 = ATCC 6013]|uniref:4Fe4S-binding SPASM domain containing protein n=1 Tax=Clostridium pasteurianum DSM 525 = ATCC 6013 TaxID=1262449 RepID=A0A0H3IYI5_CLOPA|nr:radical SAM protein [Clostridium pasteurianum]AJA46576.1 radical SAM domain-containing protein [Clostridium pasteurianum DSM 525 = ATCC 6013]AJA50564.1 radical SAM domain-containing protein [Clostridium pasteurianum DSM 525 = ATCC 6013]AOZ73995.1 hypothetical protein AQ983_02290 [Clostridium pasteurianum DSM 525 = ATCC 6013]AOZ77792.1 hypothetical protein AQ984_02290 [Clostridium pasteurianum]ELP61146.1 radical SAM domain-containing protein [Clostridium pasteurianum DSM 525 = ATCC 6013]
MFVSNYITISKINEKEYILIHSYLNNIDIVEKNIAINLIKAKNSGDEVKNIEKNIFNELHKKGYLIKDKEEDRNRFIKLANKVLEISKSKVSSYVFIPSYKCNFRCPYCFELKTVKNESNNKIMDKSLVDIIYNEIDKDTYNDKKISISLFGGEPFLKENYEIIKYILKKSNDRKIKIDAITNGYEMQYYNKFFEIGAFSKLQITLDGDECMHDSRRFLKNGEATFQVIAKNIDNVLKFDKGPHISIRVNVDKDNYHSVKKLHDFIKNSGWYTNNKFSFYTKSVHACYLSNKEKIYDSDVIENVKLDDNKIVNMCYNAQYKVMFRDVEAIFDSKQLVPNFKTSTCGATKGMKVIDAFGNIYTCLEEVDNENNRVGTIDFEQKKFLYNSLWDLWQNRQIQNIDRCSRCGYSLTCGGNCPEHAKISNKDIYTSYCADIKKTYERVVREVASRYGGN